MRKLYFIKIYYVIDGNLTILNNTNLIKYHSHQVFWVHDYDNFELIDFSGKLVSITLNNFYYHEITKILNSEHILKQPIPLPNSLNQYFNAVIEDTNDNNAPNIQNNLRQLIQLIFQIDVHTKSTDCITSNISIIEAIVKHINQCSTDNHNCLWFAKRYYLNYSYLSREFSSFMSCPLSEYILGCKIHASACELYRGLSSEQIWEKYNFKSHQDYLLHFKRIHSCFPQEFKQYTSNR